MAPDLGSGDGQEVAGEADRRSMEVPARLDATVGQHAGVVDRRHQFGVGHRTGKRDGVARRAVHLRGAAQRVGILNTGVVGAMAGDDRAAVEQPPKVGGRHGLAVVRSQRHQVGGERTIGRHQCLDAHRRGDVGGAHEHVEIGERQHQHPEHAVGAVDQRQPFLGPQRDRLQYPRRPSPPRTLLRRSTPARRAPTVRDRHWRPAIRARARQG